MRNIIFGVIGILWGLAIILYALLSESSSAGGTYQAGKIIGILFGVLLFVAGPFYLIRGLKELKDDKKERRKKPRKRRRE